MKKWYYKPWYKRLGDKIKKLKPLFTKAFWKDVKISFTLNIKSGWLNRTFGMVVFGHSWQFVSQFNDEWYHWLVFVAGTLLGLHMVDKGYKKLYRGDK
ncbi:hypothetical protein ACQVQY_11895 [Bacillus mycoides]|uniref:hypothetical protein n=1 Tax=Bacillus mycoides TaxID=1405 RepID=UPI003D648C3F